ncbi:hypothetical protein BJQ89_00577 [Arthrobacter sp. ES1]|nr:hypothetical protein [Arthrobacter sp. ES1]
MGATVTPGDDGTVASGDGDCVAPGEAAGDVVGMPAPPGAALGSVRTSSMICSLNPSSFPWISESGTFCRFRPYSAICCHSACSLDMLSELSGPSRVRTSWLARA